MITKNKLVSVRRNKNYTSILLNEITEEAFKESIRVYEETEGNKVIKPTQKAYDKFLKLHSLTIDKIKAGEKYKILGTTFEVIRDLDKSRDNEWYPVISYYDRKFERYEEYGMIASNNFAANVMETCFKNSNSNGALLFF